jgi:PAS domain S-box-containing protein
MLKLELSVRSDDRLTVTAKFGSPELAGSPSVAETTYDNENAFLELLIEANLDEATTENVVVAVLRSIAKGTDAGQWVSAFLTEEQVAMVGLNLPATPDCLGTRVLREPLAELPLGLADNAAHFYDFLMNAPTPFVMLSGPDHVFTFINPPYVQLLGRTSADQLLGLPVRKALPEPGFDVCLSVCHRTYETGQPTVRRELLNSFRQQDTGLLVEAYFDIVYHPVRNSSGSVVGIMAQATDVTERVLSRQVSENREQKLYRLWAELEGIYAAAPVGIAVVDARDFKLLRFNALQTEFFGESEETLSSKTISEIWSTPQGLIKLLKRAAAGEKFVDTPLEASTESDADSWLVSIVPSLDPSGQVDTLTLITQARRTNRHNTPELVGAADR